MNETGRPWQERVRDGGTDGRGDRIVTWGYGGRSATVTGLDADEARDVQSITGAWGGAEVRHQRGDVPRWAGTGRPLPGNSPTRMHLELLRSREELDRATRPRDERSGR